MPQNDTSTLAADPNGSSAALPRLRLTHLTGSLAGGALDIEPTAAGAIKLGRHPDSAVRYDHTEDFLVSTRHGQLLPENGQWVVLDTNSTNGTYVDGARISGRAALRAGQVVTLGTPNAPGSASFRVDVDPAGGATVFGEQRTPWDVGEADAGSAVVNVGAAGGATADGGPQGSPFAGGSPFAQGPGGPPPLGGNKPAGRPTPAPAAQPQGAPVSFQRPFGMGGPPAVPGSPGAAAPGSGAPQAGGPGAAVEVDQPSSAGIIGGFFEKAKKNYDRRKEKAELKKELAVLEPQFPQLEADAEQACVALGKELWHGASRDKLGSFVAAVRLADAEVAAARAAGKRASADQEYGFKTTEYQSLIADWQEQAAALEAELAAADQALADAQADQGRVREAVVAALAPKADVVGAAAEAMAQWAAEAKADPRDDAWQRLLEIVDGFGRQAGELATPVAKLPDLMASRAEARDAVEAAKRRHDEVVARVEESKKDRAELDAARAEEDKAHEQALAFAKVEMDRAAAQFPPAYAELGRQFVEARNPPTVTPPPESVPAARSAVGRLTMAGVELDQKRKRMAELEAS